MTAHQSKHQWQADSDNSSKSKQNQPQVIAYHCSISIVSRSFWYFFKLEGVDSTSLCCISFYPTPRCGWASRPSTVLGSQRNDPNLWFHQCSPHQPTSLHDMGHWAPRSLLCLQSSQSHSCTGQLGSAAPPSWSLCHLRFSLGSQPAHCYLWKIGSC